MKSNILKSRQNRLKEHLSENDLDLAIIMSPVNINYFTGFNSNPHERFFALVVDNRKDNVSLFVPSLDMSAAEEHACTDYIISVSDIENPYDKLRETIKGDVSSFGIEKNYVSVHRYEQIGGLFDHTSFVNLEPFIASKRIKKTNDEFEAVQRSVNAIEQVMEKGIEKFVSGMTELELKAELEYQMLMVGAEGPAFETIVLSGENSALPHGHSGNREIKNGDFLLIDMGVILNDYCSDITRTFIVGEASEKQVDVYETVLEANNKAIDVVKAGEPLMNIDRVARDHIDDCNYGQYFSHRIGHGLGLEVHEQPSIHNKNRQGLEPGMLFTVEPGVYIPGFGGVRIEDNICIDEDEQVRVLTSFPKSLKLL